MIKPKRIQLHGIESKRRTIKKAIDRIDKSFRSADSILVGLPSNSRPYPDGTPVIMVAAVHEFGTTIRVNGNVIVIPERSFLRSTLEENKEKYLQLIRDIVAESVRRGTLINNSLNAVGLVMRADVQTKIDSGPFESNAGSTLLAKNPKTKPLIHTGHLRSSIEFVILPRTQSRKRRKR